MNCRWFLPGIPVSFANKTDRHDITEILLKVALDTITITLIPEINSNLIPNTQHLLETKIKVLSL